MLISGTYKKLPFAHQSWVDGRADLINRTYLLQDGPESQSANAPPMRYVSPTLLGGDAVSCPPSIHPPLFCLTTQHPSLERVYGTTKVGFDDVLVEHSLCSTSILPLQFVPEAKERYHLVLFLLLLYVHVRTYRTHRLHEGPPPKVSEPSAKPINHLAAAASLSAHLSPYTHSAFITRKGGWKGEPPLPLPPPKVPPFPPPPPPPISLLFQHMCNIYIPVFICLYIFPLSSSPVPADILSSFSSPTTVASLPSYERTYSPVWPFACDIRRLIFTRAYYETGKLSRCFLNKAGNERLFIEIVDCLLKTASLRTYSNETEHHPSTRPKSLDSRPPTAQKTKPSLSRCSHCR